MPAKSPAVLSSVRTSSGSSSTAAAATGDEEMHESDSHDRLLGHGLTRRGAEKRSKCLAMHTPAAAITAGTAPLSY